MHEYLIDDICYQYILSKTNLKILVILEKISKISYYKHMIFNNERLIEKIIQKFSDNKNKELVKYLLSVLTSLTEDNSIISRRIYDLKIMEKITSYIRFYDNDIKILSINLMVNVLSNANLDFTNEPMVIWSISILLNLVKDEANSVTIKTRCMNIFSLIINKSGEMQNIFFNLDGIETVLKELRMTYSDEKIKEIEESIKSIKNNKNKKSDKEKSSFFEKEDETICNLGSVNNNSNFTSLNETIYELDETGEYRASILECLSSAASIKEESRRKIIESKELSIVLKLLDESNSKLLLSTARAILSLSRAHISFKKYLHEYDITSWLFKLVNHQSVEVQIAITNSLCNFLLDYSSNINEILECVSKLLKILTNTKHNKIRFNSIFSIKNIFFYISSNLSGSSNRDIKRQIMKKISYDFLLNLLDDEDIGIQEQALLIFRVLLFKTSEDVEEVFTNCKVKLLKKVEEKLNASNSQDILLQSLYILCNISTGLEKHKSALLDEKFLFLNKISFYLDSNNWNIKNVCVLILNNLLTNTEREKSQDAVIESKLDLLRKHNILTKLEKIANEEDAMQLEIKQNAISILSQVKSAQKK